MKQKTYAFLHANVIPMDEESVMLDQAVVVQNGRISHIGDADQASIPDGAIQIDAEHQYLIPALSDMHVHLEGEAWNIMFPPEKQFSLTDQDFEQILFPYLANGITTIQVMSALPEHIALRDRIARGEILGPRLILNRMIDGPAQSWPPPINTHVSTPEEARQIVLESKDAGYDRMKVYSFLDQECYDAIVATAQEVGMPVIGHIPDALSLEHVLARGQNLIAHSEEVMKQARGDYSPEKIEIFAEMIANSNTWITPTLTTSRKILAIFDDLESECSRPETRYLHPMARGIWSFILENMYLKIPAAHQMAIREGFEAFQLPFTKALHAKGVKLIAGTDVLIPTNIPGFSLHDELVELIKVGLSPYEALKAATVHPKAYLEALEDTGTIEIGKCADLVLLKANPLEDIHNARETMGVMYRGNWLDQADIQKV
jgi:cytosine/adenosine deaminase-related metal-dependent hydrolase